MAIDTLIDILFMQLGGCNIDLENKQHFTASDYAFSFAVRNHIKGTTKMIQMYLIISY
jgi:hypothetical protein